MSDDLRLNAQKLSDSLRESGHHQHAEKVSNALSAHLLGNAFLEALRAACDTLVTMVEAIDPVSEMELERVRRGLDGFLTPEKPHDK
jgi:hypothetical protein